MEKKANLVHQGPVENVATLDPEDSLGNKDLRETKESPVLMLLVQLVLMESVVGRLLT